MEHPTMTVLRAGLDEIRRSPRNEGAVELLVVRPAVGERHLLDEAQLDTAVGMVGDTWSHRPGTRTPDGVPHPDMQLTIMNSRVIALLAQDPARWALAGDQV